MAQVGTNQSINIRYVSDIQSNHNFDSRTQGLLQLQPVVMDASNRMECLPGTRTDILKSIEEWTNDVLINKSIFWFHSIPGAGKSVISTTIANRLRTAGRLGAFLFFDRYVTQRNDPNVVVRTIAYQMGSYDHQLGNAIHAAIKNIPSDSLITLREQFQKFIVEPLLATRRRTAKNSNSSDKLIEENNMPVIVVLDSLDQCGNPGTREGLLAVLAEETARADLASILRIIVASRATPDIRSSFWSQNHIISYELDTTSDTNIADIQRYFWHHAEGTRHANKYLRLSENWPGQNAIQSLTMRAHGLFIWAATAWAFIDGHYPQKRIEMLLTGRVARTAAAALDVLYETTLESAGNWDDKDFLNDFHKILGVIIVANVPLSSNAIDRILHLSSEQPSLHTIARLRCVLSQSPAVRILHPSFADFLCTRAQCGKGIWFVDPMLHKRALTIRCLELLNSTLKRNICNLTLSADLETETLPEEIAYACIHWIDHVCGIKDDILPVLVHVDICLNRHLLHWIEAMSILKRSRDTTRLLNNLLKWIVVISSPNQTNLFGVVRDAWHALLNNFFGYMTAKSPDLANLFELVKDACHFSQTFAKSIEEHPLLVYFGALPFAPITSAIYQKFHDDTLLPSVSGGFQQSWSSIQLVNEYPASSVSFSLGSDRLVPGPGCKIIGDTPSDIGAFPVTRGNCGTIQSIAFSSDGSHVISHSCDESVLEWDVISGIQLSTHVAPDYASGASDHLSPRPIEIDRSGWVIHTPTRRVISKLPALITPLCSTSNEKSVAIGIEDRRVIILNFPPVVLTSPETRFIDGKKKPLQMDQFSCEVLP